MEKRSGHKRYGMIQPQHALLTPQIETHRALCHLTPRLPPQVWFTPTPVTLREVFMTTGGLMCAAPAEGPIMFQRTVFPFALLLPVPLLLSGCLTTPEKHTIKPGTFE